MSSNAPKPTGTGAPRPGPSSAPPAPPANLTTATTTTHTTYPLTSSSLPHDHRLHIARFTTHSQLDFDTDLKLPITLSRRELRDLPRSLPQSVIDAQAKAAAAAAAAAEQSAEQAAAEAKASGMGMAAAALGTPAAADADGKGKDAGGAELKKYPPKKEKQVADPSKIAPYGGARVPAAGTGADDDVDPAATPAAPGAPSAAAPKSSAFQKRTREIRMVDDAVRLARREEITPWVLHGADPGASEKAARRLKRRTMRKMLVAAGKVKEAERLESSEEEEEEEEVKEEEKKDEEPPEDKMDVDAKPEGEAAPGAPAAATGPKWKRKNEKEKFRYRVPNANERVFLGAREDPQSEYFLFIHDTEPVPGITKASSTHFKVTPVSNWFKFAERNLRAPTITADQAEELIKLKRSRRAAPGAPTSAAAKLLHRLNQADSGDADGGSGAGRVSTKRAGGGGGSSGSGGGGKDWGDVDELDFDLTEQFADDEEDVVGDLEDENEGFKSQIKQMFALGLGGEAMDEDFDEDFLVEDTAGAAKGGANAAGSGGAGAGAKGKQLSTGGKQMIKLLRSQGYESEDDEDEWFGSDEEGDEGEADAATAGQDAGEGQASAAAAANKPSDAVMRALAAAATAKAKSAAGAANGAGQAKRSASAANLDPAPKNGSGGQNPNPPPPPFSRDEIRATLRSRGPLTAGQLIQALPRGQEQIAVYGKEAFVEVLKASMVQKDANKKLHLRQ